MLKRLKKITECSKRKFTSGMYTNIEIYKFALIISCDNQPESSLKKALEATFSSLKCRKLNKMNGFQVFIVFPNTEKARALAESCTGFSLSNCEVAFADNISAEICNCISKASAQYITVLKAGDIYSENAFSAVYHYFADAEDATDTVGIRIENQNKIYNKYNEALSQKTINLSEKCKAFPRNLSALFIKSDTAKKKAALHDNFFDEQMFIMDVLENNKRFGAVASVYVKPLDAEKTVFTAQMFKNNLEKILDYVKNAYCRIGFIPSYMQNYIMAEIMKMLNHSENIMESFHPISCDYSEMWNTLSVLLQYVCDQIIYVYDTARFNKLFLLAIKHKHYCTVSETENGAVVAYNDVLLYNLSEFASKIELVSIKNRKLIIEGVCRYPSCIDHEKISVWTEINGIPAEAEQVKRYTDKYFYDKQYIYEKGFKAEIPLNAERVEIKLVTGYENHRWHCGSFQYSTVSAVSDEVSGSYYYKDGFAVIADATSLLCFACDEQKYQMLEAEFRRQIKAAEPHRYNQITAIRDYYFKNSPEKKKQIWLIMDRPDRADDNAEAFFRYMAERAEPDIDLYFILSRKSEAYSKLSRIGKVIEPFSEEHKKLYTVADYMISSQMAESTINPFNNDLKYFRDLFRNPKQIFLQHGVIHNDHGSTLNKYNRDFFGFVTSAKAEYNYLLSPKFHYTEQEMWLTGMPRFDFLYRNDKRKITIMPTWRKFLTTRVFDEKSGTMIWKVNDDFTDSEYFRFFNNLINNEKLLDAADRYGYKICFMPHVIFLKEAEKFAHNSRITIYNYEKSYREIYAESSLIVTDYSSAVFDFSYLRQPIIYTQFDFDEFYSKHTVRKGYFNFKKDGFGEVTDNQEDTVNLIIGYMADNCRLKPEYRERIDNFFDFSDKKCCERIYNKIRNKDKSENNAVR